jgi:DNA-3-methyladenine glycosylase
MALGVTGELDGADATDPGSALVVQAGAPLGRCRILTGPRVGVAGEGAHVPWRFWLAEEPTVSAYRPAVARRRGARLSPPSPSPSPPTLPG